MTPDNAPLTILERLRQRFTKRPASLRVRLAVWYVLFSFLCMGVYGALLSQYLEHELRASREETMRRREHRFLAFIEGEARLYPERPLSGAVAHFQQASPESDLTEILDLSGHRLYPQQDPGMPLPDHADRCTRPCILTFSHGGHQMRALVHQTEIAGQPRWLILGGVIDEHYDIPYAVREGYFLLLPIVLIGSVVGGFELSRRALLPVGQMTEAARRLSISGLDGHLPVPHTGDELQALAEAWNDLLGRLEAEVIRSTQFTMDASHDLRTSVTVILSNAQLALRRERPADEYRETLTTIQQEALCVLTMLEEMLLAARSGASEAQVTKESVALEEIVADVCEGARAAATMKSLRFELGRFQRVRVLGDRALLRRMVNALLENAVKYTAAGGSVQVSLDSAPGGMLFAVRDTGIGIDPSLHGRIFDRLYRVDATRPRLETSGNGLGLSIAKWIADIHGFTLKVESSSGQGSCFSVLVPASAIT